MKLFNSFNFSAFRKNYIFISKSIEFIPVVRDINFGLNYNKFINCIGVDRSYVVSDFEIAQYLRKKGNKNKIILIEKFINEERLLNLNKLKIDIIIDNYSDLNKIIKLNQLFKLNNFQIYLKVKDNFSKKGFDINSLNILVNTIRYKGYTNDIKFVFDFYNISDYGNIYNINNERFNIISKKINNIIADFYILNDYAFLKFSREALLFDFSNLYGLYGDVNYNNVVTFRSTLDQIRNFNFSGKKIRIGVIKIGFKNGYLRNSRSNVPILINGIRANVIGTVKSEFIIINLNNFDDCKIGSEAILWGRASNGKMLSIHEVSSFATYSMRKMVDISAKIVPMQTGLLEFEKSY
ncbi:alanine racemase C-terminal domain-containing protein [Acinetobacter radioresistens]|uniref:alanine racemase C-terminal domain-containing protein n=1 Tax=Acinetobacter radioresistens TaxID=40216 RepID=UPI0009463F2D|nr:alanine racemase C-terminal domain-containing protein [Acinetobacter radioresistens]